MSLDPDVQVFLNALRELEEFLSSHNEFWANNVRQAANEVANSDAKGLRSFLSFFGGMGSLNDLTLWQQGTYLDLANARLETLRSNAWEAANALQDELD